MLLEMTFLKNTCLPSVPFYSRLILSESVILRNRENISFREQESVKSKTLESDLEKLRQEHNNYVTLWSEELERTKGEHKVSDAFAKFGMDS